GALAAESPEVGVWRGRSANVAARFDAPVCGNDGATVVAAGGLYAGYAGSEPLIQQPDDAGVFSSRHSVGGNAGGIGDGFEAVVAADAEPGTFGASGGGSDNGACGSGSGGGGMVGRLNRETRWQFNREFRKNLPAFSAPLFLKLGDGNLGGTPVDEFKLHVFPAVKVVPVNAANHVDRFPGRGK